MCAELAGRNTNRRRGASESLALLQCYAPGYRDDQECSYHKKTHYAKRRYAAALGTAST